MRLRLVHTLSLLMLTSVLLSVLAMGAVTAWNLRSGFADYLSARDVEHLEQFAALVAESAAREGGADAIRQGRLDMRALLDRFAQRQGVMVARGPGPPPGPPDRAGPPRPFGGGPPRQDPQGFGARVAVVGIDGERLIGRPMFPEDGPFIDRPIRLGGEVVALARMRPGDPVPDAVDSRFLRSQYLGIIGVAVVLLLLALVSAWSLARRWVRPLQAVQDATARIARGQFDVRVGGVGGAGQAAARSDEIGDVERNINQMAEGLQRLEGARRRWLADISHELRTPLTVLRGEIEALVDGVRPIDRAAMLSLRQDALRLGALVDDLHLLAMSDLQALPCRFTEFDAAPFVRDLALRYASRATAQGLVMEIDIGADTLRVVWDDARIEQLLVNLLENSLRYTDAPGRIVLAMQGGATALTLDLDDSAPGVPAADRPRLFEPLYRADAARSRHRGGSGLGLAICEAIVRSHGGSITAGVSTLGGLHIHIELPNSAGTAS